MEHAFRANASLKTDPLVILRARTNAAKLFLANETS